MSELDDRVREGLERLAPRADGAGAIDDVARRKRRYRTARRARAGALAVAVVLGSAAGIWGLSRTFDTRPSDLGPVAGPTPRPSPSATVDPTNACRTDGQPFLERYRPIGPELETSVVPDGRSARVRMLAAEEFPTECRYFLDVQLPEGDAFHAAVPYEEWVLVEPELLVSAEIDGEPGEEVIIDLGGPGHPHRTGVIFTFHDGRIVPMRFADRQPPPPKAYVDLGGEFAVGVDCAGDPGTIVTTWGVFAGGGEDDSRFDITRIVYRAVGAVWEEIDREMTTVEVGTERERWPEIADDPFRSCPR